MSDEITLQGEVNRMRNMSPEDLETHYRAVIMVLKENRLRNEMIIGTNIIPGSRVSFQSKKGMRLFGVVTKVNIKSCNVDVDPPTPNLPLAKWKVQNSLLRIEPHD